MMQKPIVLLLLCVLAASSVWAGQDKPFVTDSCNAHSGTKVPKFRTAWNYTNRDRNSTVLTISIAPRDTDRERVTELACKLGRDYAKDRVFVLWILDDFHAAKQFGSTGQYATEAARRAVRASYSFDREKNSQDLTWVPDQNKPFDTIKIMLGPPPPVP